MYLKGYWLGGTWWIDDHRYLAEMFKSKDYDYGGFGNNPKLVIVDIESGKVTDTGYVGEIKCYSEGRIAMSNRGTSPDEKPFTWYLGKLGEPLQKYPEDGVQDLELNKPSCQMVPKWKRPEPRPDGAKLESRFPLKLEHGAIFMYQPQDFPVLQLGVDANNRPAFIRSGAKQVLPRLVYLEKPNGERIDIPMNPGEVIWHVEYMPFDNAYMLSIDLTDTQPIQTWEPRFVRLLSPDGTIKRYGVPRVIMDLIRSGSARAFTSYNKMGVNWSVGFKSSVPDPQHLAGVYRVRDNELVKSELGGSPGPDGCKLFGGEPRWFSKLENYYYFDICKGEK